MFRLRSVAISEGIGADSRGFLTLVGWEPQAVVVPSFPGQAAPVIAAVFEGDRDDRVPVGTVVSFRCEVQSPDGVTVFFNEVQQPAVAGATNPHLPRRLQVVNQIPFVANQAGVYTARITLSFTDSAMDQLEAVTHFYVLDQVGAQSTAG